MRRQRSCSSMLLYYNPDYHSRRIPIPSSDHLLFSSLLFSYLLLFSLSLSFLLLSSLLFHLHSFSSPILPPLISFIFYAFLLSSTLLCASLLFSNTILALLTQVTFITPNIFTTLPIFPLLDMVYAEKLRLGTSLNGDDGKTPLWNVMDREKWKAQSFYTLQR